MPLDARAIDRALRELTIAKGPEEVVVQDPAAETAFALPAIRPDAPALPAHCDEDESDAPVGSPAYWRRQMRLDAHAAPPPKRSIATWVRKLTRRADSVAR